LHLTRENLSGLLEVPVPFGDLGEVVEVDIYTGRDQLQPDRAFGAWAIVGSEDRLLARSLALVGCEPASKQARGTQVRRVRHHGGDELRCRHRLWYRIIDRKPLRHPQSHLLVEL